MKRLFAVLVLLTLAILLSLAIANAHGTREVPVPKKSQLLDSVLVNHADGLKYLDKLITELENRVAQLEQHKNDTWGLRSSPDKHRWASEELAHMETVTHVENIMRGISPAALNTRKTRCKRGHPFSKENTYRSTIGRVCRQCARQAARRYRKQCRTSTTVA